MYVRTQGGVSTTYPVLCQPRIPCRDALQGRTGRLGSKVHIGQLDSRTAEQHIRELYRRKTEKPHIVREVPGEYYPDAAAPIKAAKKLDHRS